VVTGGRGRGHPRGCVVCLGHSDRGDDGVGPLVADEIRRSHPDVDVRECRDPFDVLDVVADTVVVVDAARIVADPVRGTDAAGTVHVVTDVEQAQASRGLASTHGLGLAEVLALVGEIEGDRPRVMLVAVVGERFDMGAGASDAVTAAVPAAAEQAVRLLRDSSETAGER